MKIGCIGLGNMGGAVAKAVAHSGKHDFLLSNHNTDLASRIQEGIGGVLLSNKDLIAQADVVFLAVKPQMLLTLLEELKDSIIARPDLIWISMVAGVTVEQLGNYLPVQRTIRMMPNTPVAIGQGMTTFSSPNPEMSELFQDLMADSGRVMELPEGLLDAATAIAGCGPAFVYQFIEALSRAGVQHGLTMAASRELAAQTLVGAADMVLQTEHHPAQLRDYVTSPGGSTIAGLVSLEEAGFTSAVVIGVNRALERTRELGQKKD